MWQKKWIIGNWKMNGCLKDNAQFLSTLNAFDGKDNVHLGIAAPSIYLHQVREQINPSFWSGAQDVSRFADVGAYTGEISASMLRDCGVHFCLIGHSERRQYFAEDENILHLKIHHLLQENIVPILCVGETAYERENGQEKTVVKKQLSILQGLDTNKICVAYEPVWAIGSGQVASVEQIEQMHTFIYQQILSMLGESVSIRSLYGGSVNDKNADTILSIPYVDGALVGGASLKADTFLYIARTITGY